MPNKSINNQFENENKKESSFLFTLLFFFSLNFLFNDPDMNLERYQGHNLWEQLNK
ncbi:hypothetical protein BN969_16080 [Staphylococcus aureus]|nr:hypothetical protein BN969_16080 [Staphylococcus aureus]